MADATMLHRQCTADDQRQSASRRAPRTQRQTLKGRRRDSRLLAAENFEDHFFANGRSNLNGDLHLFVDDTGIDSAKSECVAKNVRQIFFARLVGNHIQIARWIGGLIIQSRWN